MLLDRLAKVLCMRIGRSTLDEVNCLDVGSLQDGLESDVRRQGSLMDHERTSNTDCEDASACWS